MLESAHQSCPCASSVRRLRTVVAAQTIAVIVVLTTIVASCATATGRAGADADTIRARELVIVDANGVERVRLGGDLPDPVISGKRVPRGQQAAGVLLYDGSGRERSGYVTWEPSGNVGLTLDTDERQVALFVAGAESGSALQLWHGGDAVELRADSAGSRFTAVTGGEVRFQEPAVSVLTEEMCAAYRDALSRVSGEQVMRDCRRRFVAAACRGCLEP